MAPSQMNLSAVLLVVVLVLLPVVMAAGESASVGQSICGEHLSGSFKGICIGIIHGDACSNACMNESRDNFDGFCKSLQCWCENKCTSGTEAVASSPIRQ
ncbi:hypothetical protein PVAP13_3KG447400 [Panicum virgatum]|uniref:Knottin scorpion toxin-like domain-containing protein n=1 Tax=Panicum virgatum TaxID=38727 RepID=A0A8T0V868_PANVG|nr:hypothetical protein PVAP13_3KG447400 [Panicum virgatum]